MQVPVTAKELFAQKAYLARSYGEVDHLRERAVEAVGLFTFLADNHFEMPDVDAVANGVLARWPMQIGKVLRNAAISIAAREP